MYDDNFYQLETEIAVKSAEVVLPWVLQQTGAKSVIDIGCGTGGWAYVAKQLGCEVLGVDHQVPPELQLLDEWIDHDLTAGYNCWEWDLAVCLEVAEHLPEKAAFPLVRGLSHANTVLWSAATPGQPGVGHSHCQPPEYWAEQFALVGMEGEYIGSRFIDPVADFYIRNLYLYRKAS